MYALPRDDPEGRRMTTTDETATTSDGAGPGEDPFGDLRAGPGVAEGRIGTDEFLMVLRYEDVKAVTRDWHTFTSDAPFRVPIPAEHDVRSVRQLPIETNPPDHTDYRDIVKEPFSRATAAAIAPDVRRIADDLVDEALAAGEVEVVRSFALPIQNRALALMLGRSQDEATRWISWGTHVFRDAEGGHAGELDQYLDEVIDAAIAAPGDDFFGILATADFRGRKLTREEMTGFANLTFAGGRDTVINSIVNSLDHLARHPADLERLRREPDLIKTAVEEFIRFFSPVTQLGRVVAKEAEVCGHPVAADSVVGLCFASANRDDVVFADADTCAIDRHPNRHVAFGHGPHTCLGAPLARMVLATVLESFVAKVATASVTESVDKVEDFGVVRRHISYERLVLALTAR